MPCCCWVSMRLGCDRKVVRASRFLSFFPSSCGQIVRKRGTSKIFFPHIPPKTKRSSRRRIFRTTLPRLFLLFSPSAASRSISTHSHCPYLVRFQVATMAQTEKIMGMPVSRNSPVRSSNFARFACRRHLSTDSRISICLCNGQLHLVNWIEPGAIELRAGFWTRSLSPASEQILSPRTLVRIRSVVNLC